MKGLIAGAVGLAALFGLNALGLSLGVTIAAAGALIVLAAAVRSLAADPFLDWDDTETEEVPS